MFPRDAPRRVLGFDPGSRVTGWGVVELKGRRLMRLDSGIIWPDSKAPIPERLQVIYRGAIGVLDQWQGIPVGVETAYVPPPGGRGSMAGAIKLAQARGSILAAIGDDPDRQLIEVAPSSVKKAVACHRNAKKLQVQFAVRNLLDHRRELREDEADALAVAIAVVTSGTATPTKRQTMKPEQR